MNDKETLEKILAWSEKQKAKKMKEPLSQERQEQVNINEDKLSSG